MIELRSLLQELDEKNISIAVREDGKLVLNGDKKSLSPELLDLVKLHKEQLLSHLSCKTIKKPQSPQSNKQICSFAQRRFWLQEQLHSNVQQTIKFSIPVSASISDDLVRKAFALLCRRHAILRTTYYQEKEEVYQRVQQSGTQVEIHRATKTAWPGVQVRSNVSGLLQPEQIPLKVYLLRDPSGEGLLHAIVHHIICEAESLQILKDDFAVILHSLLLDEGAQLPEIKRSYVAFAFSERQYLLSKQFIQDKVFWENYLADIPLVHSLPLNKPRAKQMSYSGESHELIIRGEIVEQARQFCSRLGLTQHLFLQGVFAITLSAFSKSNDIVIGIPFSNRPTTDYRNVVGLFQNTRISRHLCASDLSVNSFFQALRQGNRGIMQHEQMPFELLVDHINPPRSQQFTPLFQIIMISNVFNHRFAQNTRDSKLEGPVGIKAELSLIANIYQDAYDLNLEFNTDIFNSEFAHLVLAHMQNVLQKILLEEAQVLQTLITAPDTQVPEMLRCLSGKSISAPQASLFEQFSDSVSSVPDSTALVCGERTISYRALSERIVCLAAAIHNNHGTDKVAFYLQPGIDSVAVMLASLKLGIAFIPLSTRLPVERIDFMLRDSECRLVVTSSDLKSELTGVNADILSLSDVSSEKRDALDSLPEAQPEDSAYILFTSGSTGKPKGVEVQQSALGNFFQSISARLGVKKGLSSLLLTNLGFDIAQLEWLLPLLHQGTCYIADEALQNNPELLVSWLQSYQFDLVQSTPSRWLQLVKCGLDTRIAEQLICGGEVLSLGLLLQIRPLASRIWNAYGPTEATIWSMLSDVTSGEIDERKGLPLSGSLENYQHCILDDNGQPVTKGAVGSLHIAGSSLAKGYVNRVSLTREKFVTRQLLLGNEQRWYNTGDLVRWCGEAQLEFLGRKDNQVKMNGYRFEPDEMEVALSNMAGIEKAALVLETKQQSGQYLVGFCYLTRQSQLEAKDIFAFLRKYFPAAVCPAHIRIVNVWPLNSSGKVDKQALLHMLEDSSARLTSAEGSQLTELERTLMEMWAQVLPAATEDLNLDFFAAGGNSIGLVTLLNLFRERQMPMTIKGLMENPTISSQVDFLTAQANSAKQCAEYSKGAADCIVKLNQRASGIPLFLVHPLLGNAFCYSELAQKLEDYLPVYGIHAPFMSDQSCRFDTLKTLANYYCQGLEEIVPEGPIYLGGASAGGRVAYIMADILQNKGRDIELLLSLDGAPTGIYDAPCTSIKSAMQESLEFLIAPKKSRQAMHNRDDVGREEYVAYAVEKIAEMDLFPGINLFMALNFFLDFHLATPVHHNLAISGTTLHVTPKNSPLRDEMNSAWRKNLLSELIFVEVDGNHMDFMEAPHFHQFATELVRQLLQLNYIRQG